MSTAPVTQRSDAPQPFARKATGLVREVSITGMIGYSAGIALPTALALAIGVFFAMAAFPGANIVVAMLIAIAVVPFVWVTFSLMAAAMPRTGGDYIYASRILHPLAGLFSNMCVFFGTLLGVGLGAVFLVTVGLGPVFGIIGAVTHHPWWTHASATLSQRGWEFGIAAFVIVVITGISMTGTKIITRLIWWCYLGSMVMAVVGILLLLFTPRGSFVSHVNSFSQPFTHQHNTYQATITAGAKAGLIYPNAGHGYSFKNTIGACFVMIEIISGFFWGVYLAGEMKGAGRRRRQLSVILGAGMFQAVLLLIGILAFIHSGGYNFVAAASNGSYGVPVSPYFSLFASVIAGGSLFAILMGLLFLLGVLPNTYGNMALTQRVPFALAFDGLIPARLAKVSDRTHTPNIAFAITLIGGIAMAAFAAYSTSFTTVLAYAGLCGLPPWIIVGFAALVMPRRRPELYVGSPADWKIKGIPVLPVCGGVCCALGIAVLTLVFYFHKNLVITPKWLILVIVLNFVLAAALYYGARAVQRSRGVDLDLVYKTLPAD